MARKTRLSSWVWVAVLAVTLGGCAGMQAASTKSKEDLLSAAGFQMRIPDTPQQTANLQRMVQRRIVAHTRNGQTYYVYADAANNRKYIGDEAAYQRYRQLLEAEKIAQERLISAELNEANALDWAAWGPPWY